VIVTPNLLENRNSMRERTSSTATGRSTGPWIPSSDKYTKVLMVRVALLAQKVQRFNDEGVTYDKRPSPQEDCIIYIYTYAKRFFTYTHTYIYMYTMPRAAQANKKNPTTGQWFSCWIPAVVGRSFASVFQEMNRWC
jgi:hypothetical protein